MALCGRAERELREAIGEGAVSVAVETPELKRGHTEKTRFGSEGDNGEGAASAEVETPGYWQCQEHEITTKDAADVEWSCPEPIRQAVCAIGCQLQRWSCPSPLEPRTS